MKSHFASEERLRENILRERRETSGAGKKFVGKRLRTNTSLWSLTSRTKRDFGNREREFGEKRKCRTNTY